MTPTRFLSVAAAVAVLGFLVLRRSSDDPSETPPLTPEAVDASISSGNRSAVELAAVSDAAPSGNDRGASEAPPTPAASKPSAETTPDAPQLKTTVSSLELQRALVTEIALLEAARDELQQSLGPLTKDAYEAAWNRNDYEVLDAGPTTGRDIDGKLVSMRHLPDGTRQMVTLPRVGFEEAYKIYDLSREKSDEIQKKQAELAAMRASARAN